MPLSTTGGNVRHLVVALHGYAGTGAAMAGPLRSCAPPDADLVVVAPDGPHRPELAAAGRAWFPITSRRAAIGNRAATLAPWVARYVGQLRSSYRVDLSRTCLVGFSQGAAVTVAALAGPPVCGRAVLVCGRIPDRAEMSGEPSRQVPPDVDVLVVAGGRDRFAGPDAVRADLAAGFLRDRARYVMLAELGHEFTVEVARLALAHAIKEGSHDG